MASMLAVPTTVHCLLEITLAGVFLTDDALAVVLHFTVGLALPSDTTADDGGPLTAIVRGLSLVTHLSGVKLGVPTAVRITLNNAVHRAHVERRRDVEGGRSVRILIIRVD